MSKRFKLQFSRVIPSFQFCRSKHPSTFPVSPLPAMYRLSPINPKALDITFPGFPNPPPSTPQERTPVHPSIKRHVSSKIVSVGCGCRSRSCTRYLSPERSTESVDYSWTSDGNWHVVGKGEDDDNKPRRKICGASDSGETDDDVTETPLLKMMNKQSSKKQRNKKKSVKVKSSVRTTTRSNSSGDSGWFTNEETETLVSSRSFSNDSSSYDLENQFEKSINRQKKKSHVKKKVRKLKRNESKTKTKTKNVPATREDESPLRTSVFRRMMPCTVDGKVRESFAVVKKSEDPYEDFKRSMLEMILEKQMFEMKDLEELLHCFLSLNSREHHVVIVEAFSEIWEVLFSKSPVMNRRDSKNR